MRFEFKPSFDRSVKNLLGREKVDVKQVAIQAIDILSQDKIIHKGIGLKRLKNNYWEIRKGLKALDGKEIWSNLSLLATITTLNVS